MDEPKLSEIVAWLKTQGQASIKLTHDEHVVFRKDGRAQIWTLVSIQTEIDAWRKASGSSTLGNAQLSEG